MWRGVEGHDRVAEHFRRLIEIGRLASTFLFVGPPGIGKRKFARELAACLLCDAEATRLSTCDDCSSCRMFTSGAHPDLLEIGLPPDKRSLSIDQFIGAKERRHHEGLCHDIALRPFAASRRVAIVDQADTLQTEGANCLLKTLEEPPPRSVLILLSTSESRQLPTIRSRCQIVRFRPLEIAAVRRLLDELAVDDELEQVDRAAAASGGSVLRAQQLLSADLWQLIAAVLGQIDGGNPNGAAIAAAVSQAADAAGKDAPERRAFLDSFLQVLIDELRKRARQQPDADSVQPSAATYWQMIDASLRAIEAIARNAHLANLILWWSQHVNQSVRNRSPAPLKVAAS